MGSEPEVGWQWALQWARFHDVRCSPVPIPPRIEPALEALWPQPLPRSVYHDRSSFLLEIRTLSRCDISGWESSLNRDHGSLGNGGNFRCGSF